MGFDVSERTSTNALSLRVSQPSSLLECLRYVLRRTGEDVNRYPLSLHGTHFPHPNESLRYTLQRTGECTHDFLFSQWQTRSTT
jgi:hypothetical protein